ncbi:tRNA (N6-threonylcarbamoyladenosine(37)-N6)-methyltransferase TrmO [Paraglaciecola sp. L3A3]|uniref:tRNA (N6-threonylcarbamoyladenosine(37)-N6)-methyltransferase TrmO n=1 Tax=Paraglaciecola sp. L3A3 TaxID=2686358 RepID=UPI00131D273E|nr:tRNA (N6-threonylcarbamoyladenosine(37)-N6)-methyltransferase TrmO [Paraglaciecola sp. L3A3]
MSLDIKPIGLIRTPYKQKFAIPRQPGLVKSAVGTILFTSEFNDPNYLRGIEQFSHLWLLFHFHQTADKGHSPLVRPPRLGGNEKLGVFATRSTFRPNSIGMSVVEFDSVQFKNKQLNLQVRGIDLLDNTPILDIKPYIPYADNIENAQGGFANQAPSCMQVKFSLDATQQINAYVKQYPQLEILISQVLQQDPRPAYRNKQELEKVYGMTLYEFNIQWQVSENCNHVLNIEKIDTP